jgi:glycogen debranching enzyme
MEPKEIFGLLIAADEKTKYAKPNQAAARAGQARELLERARAAAVEIGNEQLIAQADRRLADLDALDDPEPPPIAGGSGAAEPGDPMPASGADPEMSTRADVTASATTRPTPADPMPGVEGPEGVPSAKRVRPPPELGTDAIVVLEGLTFFASDAKGDVDAGTVGGLVHQDTRFLNEWKLAINGRQPKLLRSRIVDHYSATFFLSNPELETLHADSVSIRRHRFVGNGMHEKISVHSYVDVPLTLEVRLSVGTDFADLFEIRAQVRDRTSEIEIEAETDPDANPVIRFNYAREGWSSKTHVHATDAARVQGTDFVWDVELGPRGTWSTSVNVAVTVGSFRFEPMHQDYGDARQHDEDMLSRWMRQVPSLRCGSTLLENVYRKSVVDMASLRITGDARGEHFELPAAGLPWFMTLFGRDTIISSYQSMWVGPHLARGAIELLAATQGKERNDFKDEQPGRMLHEVRFGELTALGLKPHSPYYGAVDTTPLWLILLSEYWRWSGDDGFAGRFVENVIAALDWIDTDGDIDRDGYLDYQTRSSQGLGNQCWRDSWQGVQFHDGSIPFLPISIAEAQGYVYDAKIRIAEMSRVLFGDDDFGERLRREANELKERFNRDFWIDERGGYYAIGLDGDHRKIDSVTSNMGHLLWSGIVPDDRARAVADRLMDDAMFCGWGVRTLSSDDEGYNPIGYHLGTVWPHDNSIIAAGLARYGFHDEANKVCLGLLEASAYSEYRLPEAFAGFGRSVGRFPVPYPTACSPQAWATAAPFLFLRTMLGLNAWDGEVTLDPHLPDEIGHVELEEMPALGGRWNLRAAGTEGEVESAG